MSWVWIVVVLWVVFGVGMGFGGWLGWEVARSPVDPARAEEPAGAVSSASVTWTWPDDPPAANQFVPTGGNWNPPSTRMGAALAAVPDDYGAGAVRRLRAVR